MNRLKSYIGKSHFEVDNDEYFKGSLDGFRIYDRNLT